MVERRQRCTSWFLQMRMTTRFRNGMKKIPYNMVLLKVFLDENPPLGNPETCPLLVREQKETEEPFGGRKITDEGFGWSMVEGQEQNQ